VAAHRDVLSAFGLPVQARFELARLQAAWLRDKRYRRGVRFVVLNAIGRPEGGVSAPTEALQRALDDLAG
jgi:shikimate kinase / 3-dehydroquinate synthase